MNAVVTEEEDSVVADLSFDQTILLELCAANRTHFRLQFFLAWRPADDDSKSVRNETD